ncbi:MAG TPA: acetate uptake transporter [Halococcus sp.]|nr:acetate uptake transporter [Halococcus sp.]
MVENKSLANPVPIGLMGFALTTFIIGLIESNWLVASGSDAVIPLALLYGGLVQGIAGILAWRNGNTLAQTAFLTYGAYNIWFALFELFDVTGIIDPSASLTAFGVITLGFGIITVLWFISSLGESVSLALVFATLALTYLLIGIGYWLDFTALNVWGGYFGLASALIAAYVSFSYVTNATWGRDVVPTGPPVVGGEDESQANAGQAGD